MRKKERFTDQLEGLTFAIIIVFEFPPRESWKGHTIRITQEIQNFQIIKILYWNHRNQETKKTGSDSTEY